MSVRVLFNYCSYFLAQIQVCITPLYNCLQIHLSGYLCSKFSNKLNSNTGYNISQPDSLLPQGYLVMFQSNILQGQTDLVHELNILRHIQFSVYTIHLILVILPLLAGLLSH